MTAPRILHLGLGRFHRAHQAWYFQRLNKQLQPGETPWSLSSWSMRQAQASEQLAASHMKYQLLTVEPNAVVPETIDCIVETGCAPENTELFFDRFIHPELTMITLTLTEKGYCLDRDGKLNLKHPSIIADLAQPDIPWSAIGLLALGIEKRAEAKAPPLTIVSCDNLMNNGNSLQDAIVEYLIAAEKPQIANNIDRYASFPNSMVDRIVPSLTAQQISFYERAAKVSDPNLVVTESYSQWVIEDKFAENRPPLDRVGVIWTDNIIPFEQQKLQLLNAAHSFLAYNGILIGHEFVHEAMAEARLFARVNQLWAEVIPLLDTKTLGSSEKYIESLKKRFSNPGLPHALKQIAMDGSQKIPQRIFPSLLMAHTNNSTRTVLNQVVTSWIRYLWQGLELQAWTVNDPMADAFMKLISSDSVVFCKNIVESELFQPLREIPAAAQEIISEMGKTKR